jgi:hypothetical protein
LIADAVIEAAFLLLGLAAEKQKWNGRRRRLGLDQWPPGERAMATVAGTSEGTRLVERCGGRSTCRRCRTARGASRVLGLR